MWFDRIASGEKKEEYRDVTPYYMSSLHRYMGNEGEIRFRAGYRKDSDTMRCKVNCFTGYGRQEWGAEPDKLYLVLEILSIEEVVRC